MAEHPGAALVAERLSAADSRRILLVHGRAGAGKSTLVVGAVGILVEQGWVPGMVWMDAAGQTSHTAKMLGQAFDLSDSPVVALAAAAAGRPSVLVVDQLDAVSTYSGRMPDSYDAVTEMLEQAAAHPMMKVVLVVRTVDLENDPRIRHVLADENAAASMEVGPLGADAVQRALTDGGIDTRTIDSATLELLRVPLHLAVFCRLPRDSQATPYRTLPDLYAKFTREVRLAVAGDVTGSDWQNTISALVTYMSDNESLQAPAAVLDDVSPKAVAALASAGVLVEDPATVAFFHETYFDFLFARAFVTAGQDLHDFLVASGQQLFRRAPARQVLEHLAGADPDGHRFRVTVVRLLTSDELRGHLLDLVIGVLRGHAATPADWQALEPVAFGDSRRAVKVARLLCLPQWFDAADGARRWEALLADPTTGALCADQLVIVARDRPGRVAELVRPYMGCSTGWNNRLRAMVEWSLTPGLVDLTVELIEQGTLDGARGPIAVNSDFWTIVYGIKDEDPAGAARVVGAYLTRAWVRARGDGSGNPFTSGHIDGSTSGGESTIRDVARGAPEAYVSAVLPFVVDVLDATASAYEPGGLRCGIWSHRPVEAYHVESAVFAGLEHALMAVADQLHLAQDSLVEKLATSDHEPLRFLACRVYTAIAVQAADEAVDWLLSDDRNLQLGWTSNVTWASRQLVEAATPYCDDVHVAALADRLVDYYPEWEGHPRNRGGRGYGQYELLSAIPPERLDDEAVRRAQELVRKFAHLPPTPPRPLIARTPSPPVSETAAAHLTDDDWRRAIGKYHAEGTGWRGDEYVGGAQVLAMMLGRQAELDPERFVDLALSFDDAVHPAYVARVIEAVTGKVAAGRLALLCVHARSIAGAETGMVICRAIGAVAGAATEPMIELLEHYARPDEAPGFEGARIPTRPMGEHAGDLDTAGLNCTRGLAVAAIAEVLATHPEHAARLLPTVSALVADPSLVIRAQTARAVSQLLVTHAAEALPLAESLFSPSGPAIFASNNVMRLLGDAMKHAPDRFAPHLADCLDGTDAVAERAGQVWAIGLINGHLGVSTLSDPTELSTAARKGAAAVLADVPDAMPDLLACLFDDESPDVSAAASRAIWRFEKIDGATADALADAFTNSKAFPAHFEMLFRWLERSRRLLPACALAASARAIELAGADLGDIRSAGAAASPSVVAVVLRLYRQGDPATRIACLDLIDRMSDVDAYHLADALLQER